MFESCCSPDGAGSLSPNGAASPRSLHAGLPITMTCEFVVSSMKNGIICVRRDTRTGRKTTCLKMIALDLIAPYVPTDVCRSSRGKVCLLSLSSRSSSVFGIIQNMDPESAIPRRSCPANVTFSQLRSVVSGASSRWMSPDGCGGPYRSPSSHSRRSRPLTLRCCQWLLLHHWFLLYYLGRLLYLS